MRLQGKTAIITGAGRGIGFAGAQAFVREGAKVVIAEISSFQLDTIERFRPAVGVLLNHAEKRLTLSEIGRTIRRADEVGLATLVCADTPEEAAAVAHLGPNIILAEPPELIGSGLAGIEVYYPGYDAITIEHLLGIARRRPGRDQPCRSPSPEPPIAPPTPRPSPRPSAHCCPPTASRRPSARTTRFAWA